MPVCGDCTLCCEIPVIKAFGKAAYVKCTFCHNGCVVHDTTIPEECKLFECSYFQMEQVSENLRPDKCGVMFEKISDKVFFGSVVPGREPSMDAKKQIQIFVEQGFSVIISYKDRRPSLFLARNHTVQFIDDTIKTYLDKRKWQPMSQM